MENQPLFPRELLQEPADCRLKYFKGVTLAHPLLEESFAKLLSAIHEPAGAPLIFVVGPAGVGKTTLLQGVQQKLIKDLLPILEKELGRIPVATVEAVGPDSGIWSWKDFYKRVLMALDEPLIEYKKRPDRPPEKDMKPSIGSRPVAADLRYALEQAIRYRQPAAILIDEAQHIAKTASGRKLQDQLDCIKSLANMTRTTHALFGSYELLAFRNLSAQLSRRSIYIPFHRYRADRKSDVMAFKNVLETLALHIPLKEETNLIEHRDYLYERSIGCVGVLKDWLSKVLAHVLNKKKELITLRDLELHAFSISQCKKMLDEATYGEKELEEKEGTREALRRLLHLEPNDIVTNATEDLNSQQSFKMPTKRRRVGEPNPKRYPTGVKA